MEMDMDCDSSPRKLTDWIIEVDEKLRKMKPFQPKEETPQIGRRCIYPYFVDDINFRFGPITRVYHDYYLHEEDEEHALIQFLRRSGQPLQRYCDAVAEVVEELKDAYDQLDDKWQDNTDAFLMLMVHNGCFLIEILRGSSAPESYYVLDSPLLRIHKDPHSMECFRRDLLALENQLPMLLLKVLLDVETGGNHNVFEILEDCIGRLFSTRISIRYDKNKKCKHILEAYREALVDKALFRGRKACNPRRSREARFTGGFRHLNIPTATQLEKVGIGFTTSDTTSLNDISFHRKTLMLPQIVVDNATRSKFLNIMAFEHLHEDAGNEVTSYIYFMRKLIEDVNDVSLLKSRGIINSALPISEVVGIFRTMSKKILVDPDKSLAYEYGEVGRMLRERYNKMSNEWRKDLFQNYLRSPWAITSVVAAILLFAVSIIQTVYTVLSYVNRNK